MTAWRGFAAAGAPPRGAAERTSADMTDSQLATDATTQARVVLSAVSTIAGQGRRLRPAGAAERRAPRSSCRSRRTERLELVAQRPPGAPGVYVAYADAKAVRLYRYGGGSKTLARGPFTSARGLPRPGRPALGRLGRDGRAGLFVTRSNKAASAFEPVQKLALPQAQHGLTLPPVRGLGRPGRPLRRRLGWRHQGFWHTHLLAALLAARAGDEDEGDDLGPRRRRPGAGVIVSVGGKHLKTDAQGQDDRDAPGGVVPGAARPSPATRRLDPGLGRD